VSGAPAGWLVETLVASTLLMAAVMLLRAPVRRAFGAQVAYALWALPALRLLLPPIPAAWREAAATPISRVGETVVVLVVPAGAPVAATTPGLPVLPVLGLAWAAGAVLFLGWHLLAHHRFCRRLLAGATPLGERCGVRVVASDAAAGPLAFGVRRRFVAFPRDFADRYDPLERELALDHELGHHARGDLLANWLALAVLAIHWFSPLAWRAFRAFRADQELANDARVLAGRSRADRHIYACAIVKAAHGGAVSAACHLHTIEDLKGRLRMLTVSKTSRRRLATGAATVALLGALGLGLTVSGSRAAAALTDKVEAAVQADRAVPPVPPVPPVHDGGSGVRTRSTTVTRVDGKVVSVTALGDGKPASVRAISVNDAAVPPMQVNITSADCGPDVGGKNYVIHRRNSAGEAMVICTDRITAAAMKGDLTDADSQDIERKALTAALEGLRGSRASMAAGLSTPAAARSEALAGIDEAIREVESDLAKVGKDD